MRKKLNTTADVIDKLGGTQAVADLLDRRYTAVHNWKQWDKFPASTFVVMTRMLERLGYIADQKLWRMDSITEQ